MGNVRVSLRRLVAGMGMVGALTGLGVVLAPPMSATPALSGGGSGSPEGCEVTTGDTFETPGVPANTFRSFSRGQEIGPWKVTQNNVDLIGKGFWQAVDGGQSVDLDGSAGPHYQGGVARTFETDTFPLPLFTYVVTYCLAGNPDNGPAIKTGQVLVNGNPVHQISFDITGKSRSNMGYRLETFSFTSPGPDATVEFRSTTTPDGWGPVIDKVTFEKCLLGLFCS